MSPKYLVTLARLVAGEGTASAPGVRVLRLRQSSAWDFDLSSLDSPAARRATFLGIGIRRRRDEQRAPVGTAEHACERVRLHLDSLDDLAALLHPNHFRCGRTRHPDCV